MKRFLLMLLCLLLVLSMTACGKDEGGAATNPTEEEPEELYAAYSHDPVIDRFLVEYLAAHPNSSLDPNTIRRGVDTTEYMAVIDQCNVTMRNASYKVEASDGGEATTVYQLRIIIEGGITTEARDRMMGVFYKVVRLIDKECMASTVNGAIDHLKEQTATLQNYRFCYGVEVEQYVPIVKEVGVACRIELLAFNYIPTHD